MKNSKRRARRIAMIAAACVTTVPAARAEVDFRLLTDIDATWVDNIDLAPDDSPVQARQTEYVLRVAPGFVFEQTGQRVNSSLGYGLQSYFYLEDDERDSAYHQANASLNVAVVQDYFFFDVQGVYTQQVIDATVVTTNDLLFESVNTADALTAQASAAFRHEYDSVFADVRYTRGMVKYIVDPEDEAGLVEPIQDVDTYLGYATFGSADDQARVTWGLHYENQEARYDVAPRFRFETANAELGLLLGSAFRVIGRGGLESDPLRDTTEGGLEESFWEGGFRWTPGQRTSVEAFYGEHTFGETYSGRIVHEARFLEIDARYTEGPTTLAQELVLQPAATGTVGETTSPIPGSEYFNTITNDVYLREDAELLATLTGQRTEIGLSVYQLKRTYIQGIRDGAVEISRGVALGISRALSSTMQFEIGGRYIDATFDTDNITPPPPVGTGPVPYEYQDTLATLGLTQQLSSRISARLEANHLRREGDIEYTVNYVTLGISGEF